MKEDNYIESNAITIIPNATISQKTKDMYKKFRERIEIDSQILQVLANNICMDLSIIPVPIKFQDKQPSRNDGKRLTQKTGGVYKRSRWSQGTVEVDTSETIQVYKYTTVRQKQVAPKTAISTLLHELNHHIDYKIIGLVKSIHSKGFYLRLKYLTQLLT